MSAMTEKGLRPVRLGSHAGQHAGGSARRFNLFGEGRQIKAGLRGTVSCRASQSQLNVLNCSLSPPVASRHRMAYRSLCPWW